MILFMIVAINGPRWFNSVESAQYDFLYATGRQNPYAAYSAENGRLTLQELPVPAGDSPAVQYPVHFFVHDVSENTSREIQTEEAMKLVLDSSIRSPDGFTVVNGRRRGGWFIFRYGLPDERRYLVKENFSEQLNLEADSGSFNYYWNYRFLGWVTHDE